MTGLSHLPPRPPRPQAFSRISKLFQGNSKEIPSLLQTFPRISKLFPWPFRGKSRGYGPVDPESRFLQFCVVSTAMGGPAIPGRTRSRFKVARTPIIGKKLSTAVFREGPRGKRGVARATANADRRRVGAAQLRQRAPSNSRGECEAFVRWKRFFPKPRGCRAAKPAGGGALHRASKHARLSTGYAGRRWPEGPDEGRRSRSRLASPTRDECWR